MPYADLTALGYDVLEPDGDTILQGWVIGHNRQWGVTAETDEEALVTAATNHAELHDKLTQAQAYFAGNYANWSTMTAQQKDTAARNVQRALSNLIRHVRNDLASGGV